ncbi:MAG: cupin domain-containing protein [Myxococcales bacterium]
MQASAFTTLGSAPPDGPPNEYDAMMELVRAAFSRPNEPIETTMLSFHRVGDWARVLTQSHNPGRRDDDAAMYAYSSLFRKLDGAWKLIRTECGEGSPECDESLTLASFTKRVPEAPRELAPMPPPAKAKPTIYGQFGETSLEIAFEDLPRLVPLAKGETFKITEIARDGTASYHVVALLDAEPLHRHVTHDLMVVLLEGQGEMRIGQTTRPIGPHSIVHVPRGFVHSMRNTAKTPLIGYAVFTPPFDGKDRVAAEP